MAQIMIPLSAMATMLPLPHEPSAFVLAIRNEDERGSLLGLYQSGEQLESDTRVVALRNEGDANEDQQWRVAPTSRSDSTVMIRSCRYLERCLYSRGHEASLGCGPLYTTEDWDLAQWEMIDDQGHPVNLTDYKDGILVRFQNKRDNTYIELGDWNAEDVKPYKSSWEPRGTHKFQLIYRRDLADGWESS